MSNEPECDYCAGEHDEECGACEGTGEDYYRECYGCGGTGYVTPEHCCYCGGSPYCDCCPKCGKCIGACSCPVNVQMSDGTTRTL